MKMPGVKRPRNRKRSGPWKKKPYHRKGKRRMTGAMMARIAKRIVNRNLETKVGMQTSNDGPEIFHNNFIVMNSTPLRTIQGDGDIEGAQGQRIGDKVTLSGLSIKFMVELNSRYTDVIFLIFLWLFDVKVGEKREISKNPFPYGEKQCFLVSQQTEATVFHTLGENLENT